MTAESDDDSAQYCTDGCQASYSRVISSAAGRKFDHVTVRLKHGVRVSIDVVKKQRSITSAQARLYV